MKGFCNFNYYFSIIVFSIISADGRDSKIDKPVKKLVERFGYPFEAHEVITRDHYVLGLHRIPNNNSKANGLPPVLMMHGLLGSSADWVVTGLNRSLAFILSDNGFDVWMGNNRGNTYSKGHEHMSTNDTKYWDFSYHELGVYDAPALIKYILKRTDQKKLLYVCFSQGCTQFFVMTAIKPRYNNKVVLMSGLAPGGFTGHFQGIPRVASTGVGLLRVISELLGYFEILPHSTFLTRITDQICRVNSPSQEACEFITFLTGGISMSDELDREHYAEYLRYVPAGASNKQWYHFAMGFWSGRFRQYDYGATKNLKVYNSTTPPDYDLSKVTTPSFIYNGVNDYLAHPLDVARLVSALPNVVDLYTVKHPRLSHFDFLYGVHIKQLVYDRLLHDLMSYIRPKRVLGTLEI